MVRYHCDRCHEEVDGELAFTRVWIESPHMPCRFLCRDCIQRLRNWLTDPVARAMEARAAAK